MARYRKHVYCEKAFLETCHHQPLFPQIRPMGFLGVFQLPQQHQKSLRQRDGITTKLPDRFLRRREEESVDSWLNTTKKLIIKAIPKSFLSFSKLSLNKSIYSTCVFILFPVCTNIQKNENCNQDLKKYFLFLQNPKCRKVLTTNEHRN